MRRWGVVALLAVSIGSCRPGPGTLSNLDGVEELQDRFNRDAGATRVVLLLSPT